MRLASFTLSIIAATVFIVHIVNSITIEQCGDNTRDVERAYNLARAAANVARFDAARGTQSPFGFSAMFKIDRLKLQISLYLKQIYDSAGLKALKPDPGHETPPRFACVQRDSATVYQGLQLTYDPWQRCNPRRGGRPSPNLAFYASGTAYIFLCPGFHGQPLAPAGSHCPSVSHNVFIGDSYLFYRDYQMYRLLYPLIRFYYQKNVLGAKSVPVKELFDWNRCVGMNVDSSIKNPTNLLLYIACRSKSLFPLLYHSDWYMDSALTE